MCGCEVYLQEAELKTVNETVDLICEGITFLGEPKMDEIRNSNFS